jgi:SAM-dependent methyltransferase
LRDILRQLDLPKDGVFVDLGSGKGRVLLIAAQFRFRNVVGVEFSQELCEIARDNVKVFTQRTHITARIDVVESDVATYSIKPDHKVFFMNNPFEEVVMKRVLANLLSSVTQFPRKIWLIYHNPRLNGWSPTPSFFARARNLRPAQASSGSTTADQEKRYLSEFVRIYEETMWLVKAPYTCVVGEVYFRQLASEF